MKSQIETEEGLVVCSEKENELRGHMSPTAITALLLEAHASILANPAIEHLSDDLEAVLFELLQHTRTTPVRKKTSTASLHIVR